MAERDPEKHRGIRKALSHGFSARALASQEDVLDRYVQLFVEQLRQACRGGRPANMKEVRRLGSNSPTVSKLSPLIRAFVCSGSTGSASTSSAS